jgi:hypothetical protein
MSDILQVNVFNRLVTLIMMQHALVVVIHLTSTNLTTKMHRACASLGDIIPQIEMFIEAISVVPLVISRYGKPRM